MSGRLRLALKGAVRPHENDSAFLLDRERRAVPGRARMRRYRQDQPVDMVVVGCGPGGATLSQRLKLLEDEGLIDRRMISEVPPWVEYSLTEKGADLRRAIGPIDLWADRWAAGPVNRQ